MENQHKTSGVPENTDVFSASLANVIHVEGGKEIIIGQAWKAAPNLLVTCGHVVEPFLKSTSELQIRFPSSGNRYPIREVRMHPNFSRGADLLVIFDMAIILVDLSGVEREAQPLPISFEKNLRNFQPLSAIRYPAHLGQYSSASSPAPLAQLGRMLGELRRDDKFHILHDLALSPGDSGAPIFDDTSVVAMHCGDTASLPGLNLPTTSIRLGLWVDALKDLGVEENLKLQKVTGSSKGTSPLVTYVLSAVVLFLISAGVLAKPLIDSWAIVNPPILPLTVEFNKPLNDYAEEEPLQITFHPRSDAYIYLFETDGNKVMLLYPIPGTEAWVKAGQLRTVDHMGVYPMAVGKDPSKFHWVLLNSDDSLFNELDRQKGNSNIGLLKVEADQLLEKIERMKKKNPGGILHLEMDGPVATKPKATAEQNISSGP